MRNLDRDTSSKEKHVFELRSKLLKKHRKMVASRSLKLILHLAQSHVKGLNASTVFTVMVGMNHLSLLLATRQRTAK